MTNYYFVSTSEGRLPVKPLAEFDFRDEWFFLHVSVDDRNTVKITHQETGLAAGSVHRYEARGSRLKRLERTKADMLSDALFHLNRISEDRFQEAIRKARGEGA